jgi:hypothetical protein
MVDAERGVGRADKALELGRSVDRSTLSESTQVALAIAMSGARLDQDQVDLALAELEIPQLDPTKAFTYSPGLFRAYAEVLEELGRHQEAAEWITCAEVAEKALIEANLAPAPSDDDDDDIVVFEEEGDFDDESDDDFDEELNDDVEGSFDEERADDREALVDSEFDETHSDTEIEESVLETELTAEEEKEILRAGILPDDLLEDDVRQILMETAHLDEGKK